MNDDTEEKDFRFVYSNVDVAEIIKTTSLLDYISAQYLRYIGHVCRSPNTSIVKIMLFAMPTRRYYRNPWLKIAEMLGVDEDQAKRVTQKREEFNGMICMRFNPTR